MAESVPKINTNTESSLESLNQTLSLIELNKTLFLVEKLKEPNAFDINIKEEISALELNYKIRDYVEVYSFIRSNPTLLNELNSAPKIIKKFFPQEKLVLDVISDAESDYKILFIFIQTKELPEQALTKLNRLDDEWLLNLPAEIREKLCVHLEFV